LPLAHPESAPTFADELNATCFERLLNRGKRSFARLDRFAFDHIQRDDRQTGLRREQRLCPLEKASRGANLSSGNHGRFIAQT
jgi:hypothetical protein